MKKSFFGSLVMFLFFSLFLSNVVAQETSTITSKYDFIPGEKVIFFDDFTAENIGDFPIQWNTTGSGEVVTTTVAEGRWFLITNEK